MTFSMQLRDDYAQQGLCYMIHDHVDYVWPSIQPMQIAG